MADTVTVPAPGRPIDHLVLPTARLDAARTRLAALGFTVAPEGIHPFGTANCCVYLPDGTFLEPLASVDEARIRNAIAEGNVFVARHEAYRSGRGEEGFSAVVFGTDDAAADHAAFSGAGWSAGPMLEFSRDFVDATGHADRATFRLAFAGEESSPDCLFFTCERINTPKVDRSVLERHPNGVRRLKTVILGSSDVAAGAPVLAAASGQQARHATHGGIAFRLPNADLLLIQNDAFEREFGCTVADGEGLVARAIVFGVADLASTAALLSKADIETRTAGNRLTVLPAAGQGTIFVFEALE